MKINPKKYLYLGAVLLFILAVPMHFIYELTNIKIIGLVAPVNESVFEHLKLFSYPMVIYSFIYGYKHKDKININNWFLAILVWWLVTVLGVLSSFYIMNAGFGIESLPLDIVFLFISLLIGAIVANHVYQYSHAMDYKFTMTILIIIVLTMSYLSVNPPKLPMFKDTENNIYGFEKE